MHPHPRLLRSREKGLEYQYYPPKELTIEIIPAVDIKDGNCVRLYQGDYGRETVFSDNPLDVALRWQSMGIPRLHIVDLNGAAQGEPGNIDIIRNLAQAMLVPIQVGGGIRRIETVEMLLKLGVDRVILGTAAVEDPMLVKEACRRFGENIIVSIDIRDGKVATWGWLRETELTALEMAREMARLGVQRFICTDISRDGTLTEPNFSSISSLMAETGRPVVAAGGVSSIMHLKMLKQLGAEGAIIGKAIYTGDIDLKQAIASLSNQK